MSRGLPKKDAMKKLVEGFFAALLLKAGNKTFNDDVQELIEVRLQGK